MADEADSKSVGGNVVWVQVPLPAFASFILFLPKGEKLSGMAGASQTAGGISGKNLRPLVFNVKKGVE